MITQINTWLCKCDGCGTEATIDVHQNEAVTPKEWQWFGGSLYCSSCIKDKLKQVVDYKKKQVDDFKKKLQKKIASKGKKK